jgi:hypothetical protein
MSDKSTKKREQVWYKDPSSFLKTDRILDFWPSKSATLESRINSTSRFILYASLLLFANTLKLKFIVFGAFLVGCLAFVYSRAEEGVVELRKARNMEGSDIGTDTRLSRDFVKFANFLSKK